MKRPPLRPDLLRDLHAGAAEHRAGRLDAAEALYRKVLKHDPDHPDALNLLAVITQERGRPARAVQLLSQALRAKPDFPEALANLARAQRAAGDPEGALDSARRAVALKPHLLEGQVQLGRCLIDAKDHAGAVQASLAAVAINPRSLDAQVNLGAALTYLKEWEAAVRAYRAAEALAPQRAETYADMASALRELGLFEDALRGHDRAIRLAPDNPTNHASHALTLKLAQDAPGAVDACQRAIALDPDSKDTRLLLGGCLSALGRFGEAADVFRAVLAIDPDSAEARRGMVAAGQFIPDESEVQRLRRVAADPDADRRERVAAHFALGSLFDKADEQNLAFPHFAEGNRLARQTRQEEGNSFDPSLLRRGVDELITTWTPEVFAATREWGDPSEVPVFIVGMPRSGTTLTEQIAASHERVFGAGELGEMSRIAQLLRGESGMPPLEWSQEAIREQAAGHLARLRRGAGDAARITDKMPDNVFLLGQIAMLYPHARVVICRRDPRDVCLSCYFQRFSAGLAWSHDLTDLAARATETDRLVAHWQEVLPLPMLEVRYESLVSDQDAQSRRLIDFLGLPWDPACLNFHETERPVLTASQWQVRQPLYQSSVGRWRLYEAHLGPLLDGLAAGAADPERAA